MKLHKKIVSIMLAVAAATLTAIHASADQSVDLLRTQKATYSKEVYGMWKYIDDSTLNNKVSTQSLRAQFEFRSPGSLNHNSDYRIFVDIGCRAEYTESSRYSNNYYWRLALSPYDQSLKGVSGTGTIFN